MVLAVGGLALIGERSSDYPSSWDPRVQFAVDFIEAEKGQPFEHPVEIDFVPEDQFVQDVSGQNATVTDDDRTQAKETVSELRTLGLVQGDLDLLAAESTLHGSGTAAYYDPDTKKVRVRGTDLDIVAKGTLVHELTHAWQDQHFDLTRLPKLPTEQQQTAFRTIAEGDAVDSENAWVAKLNAADKKAYDDESQKQSDQATSGMKTVPDVLVAQFGAPYVFGPPFISGLKATGGNDKVDATFVTPPVDDAQIMNPWLFESGQGTPTDVKAPATGTSHVASQGTLGSLFVYLMLADHIDPHQALLASDAWAGDAYKLTDDSGKVCVHARVEGRDAGGVASMSSAFTAWAAQLPHLTVTPDATGVTIEGCDPGAAADLHVAGRSSKVIAIPQIRLDAWSAHLENGDSPAQSQCYGDALARNVTLDDLAKTPLPDARVAELRAAAQKACA
jgi:hypothetical protein